MIVVVIDIVAADGHDLGERVVAYRKVAGRFDIESHGVAAFVAVPQAVVIYIDPDLHIGVCGIGGVGFGICVIADIFHDVVGVAVVPHRAEKVSHAAGCDTLERRGNGAGAYHGAGQKQTQNKQK